MSVLKHELTARDIMSVDPICVRPHTTIRELARTFEEHEISGAPVIDQSGKVVGVVTKTDLIRRCSEGTADIPPAYLFEVLSDQGDDEEASQVIPEPLICVEDFMTEDPLMVAPTISVATIAKLMFERRIHRVIVADDDRFPMGIVTSLDILGAYSR
ncbi:MAG: CBS domain-containing protein [Phycisphaeraceae bacterium]|jgi:CBS domain-containing protein|nr:CBS domain-containing protein [Phycisphaeraceae bacterium]